MRRLAALTTLALAGAIAALIFGPSAQGSSSSRFDVIFDDARGLVGGQLVKVAGANAGTIENVTVTSDFKARIEATVDSRFMPFHTDATCTIRPQGLIAENYIDCDPGSANSPKLPASGSHPPTVPVQNTTEPVSLLDLFNIFNLPTRQRLTVILDELGIGTAARGQDINYILRRANPSLQLARQAISILSRQRAQLGALIDATNTVGSEAAAHTTAVKDFLDQSAALTSITAAHRGALSAGIARLPGLLAVAKPSLSQLDTVALQGTPLLQQLHAAIPSLNQVEADLPAFAAAAKPALAALGRTIVRAIPAIRELTPVLNEVRVYATASLPGTKLIGSLFSNLQQHGFSENFLSNNYYLAASLARFDSTAHMVPVYLQVVNNGSCSNYATTPVVGCSAHYGSAPSYLPARPPAARSSSSAAAPPGAAPGAGAVPASTTPSARKRLKNLVDKLLQGANGISGQQLQGLEQLIQSAGSGQSGSTQDLLNYLLK